jgi:TRAP-type C4-dicarboxylate transport system permease small subunit
VTGAGDSIGWLSRVLLVAGTVALAAMMLSTTADVVLRASTDMPIRGVVDLVEVTMLLVVFLGLPEAFLRGEQVTVDLIDHLVPRGVVAYIRAVGAALSTLFLALIAVNMIHPMLDAYRFGDRKADLPIPIWPLAATVIVCVTVSLVAMVLLTVREALRAAAPFRGLGPEEHP